MNKIYLGDVEIANTGSGGGSGDYVDTSTFAEQTHAAAAALVDLKQKHNELAKLEDALQDQEDALLAEVQAVEVAKADVSAVYLKDDIDKSDKIVAAALASLDDRVSTLETSSGGGGGGSFDPTDLSTAIENLEDALLDVSTDVAGIDASVANHESRITTLENSGGGGSFDPTTINASVNALEQLTSDINASVGNHETRITSLEQGGGGSFDPTDINSSISDISTRVSVIESDYVVSNDISAFVTQTTLDASYVALDASIQALDASCLTFDASIKELAQQGGGGGGSFDPSDINASIGDISTRVSVIEGDYVTTNDISTFIDDSYYNLTKVTNSNNYIGYVINSDSTILNKNYYNSLKGNYNYHLGPVGNIANRTYGTYGLSIGGETCAGNYAFAVGCGVNASGDYSVAFGYSSNSNNSAGSEYSFIQGYNCIVQDYYAKYAHAEGEETICMAKYQYGQYYGQAAHAEGYSCKTLGNHSHAEGYNSSTGQNGQAAHAEGNYTFAEKYCSHSEGSYTKTSANYQHVEGVYNSDSSLSLHIVGNGTSSSRHNAFEVRQSGDIYISDVSASGEYYEKPMINLQQKIYELEARIATLEQSAS